MEWTSCTVSAGASRISHRPARGAALHEEHRARQIAAMPVPPEAILERHSPTIRALTNEARKLVKRVMPDALEYGNAGWGAIAYRHPAAGYVCGLFPFADHVKFLFEHGVELDDPDGVLEGDGTQVRYVTLRKRTDVRAGVLAPLLLAAITLRAERVQRRKARATVRRRTR